MRTVDDHRQDPEAEELPPLRVPLPVPPHITLRDGEYVLERVAIEDLPAYRQRHGLALDRVAFLGRPGWRETAGGTMRWAGLGWCSVHRRKPKLQKELL